MVDWNKRFATIIENALVWVTTIVYFDNVFIIDKMDCAVYV